MVRRIDGKRVNLLNIILTTENQRKALQVAKFYDNRAELSGNRGIAAILSEHFGKNR
jgi:hypothetical protein